jgi:DNA-binding MarR family transcriptional regulator
MTDARAADTGMTDAGNGYELPLRLAGAFRGLVDSLHERLAERGHPGARPVHGFVLQAIGRDGAKISEVGRRLGVSKQAAAQTIARLERLDYATSRPHPRDGRASQIVRTERGEELLALSAEIFAELRANWSDRIGADRLAALEADLARVAPTGFGQIGDLPGWLQ